MLTIAVPLYRGPQNQRKPLGSNGNARSEADGFLFDRVPYRPDLVS